MKVLAKLALILTASFLFISTPITGFASLPPTQSASLSQMLTRVTPSIVNIQVIVKPNPYLELDPQSQNPMPPQSAPGRIGSGVIINAEKGYIVTNAHVVQNAKNMTVMLKNSSRYTAKLIGEDDQADIAVIQIKAEGLKAIDIGNSYNLKVGDFVAAIGSPFGLNQTVTSGIISSVQRDNMSSRGFQDFIQTDAPINPGNSGGALVNMQGQFIGMNTAIISPDGGNAGIGFAIPSNIVINIAKQLIEYGKVVRGLVGVMAQDITPDIAKTLHISSRKGAIISSVNQNSPAAEAGLQVGDIITKVNGQAIANSGELVSLMGLLRADSKVHFTLERDNKMMDLTAVVAAPEQIKQVMNQANPYFNGLVLQNFSEKDPLQGAIEGVRVLNIAQDSNAMQAGFMPADVIVSANLQPVKNIQALHEAAINANHQPLLLNVIRGSSAIFIVLKPDTKGEFE